MERLVIVTRKPLSFGTPVADGLLATLLKHGDRARRVGINGPNNDIRYHNGGRSTGQLQEKGTAEVLMRLQGLILDGPVQALLTGHRRANVGVQGLYMDRPGGPDGGTSIGSQSGSKGTMGTWGVTMENGSTGEGGDSRGEMGTHCHTTAASGTGGGTNTGSGTPSEGNREGGGGNERGAAEPWDGGVPGGAPTRGGNMSVGREGVRTALRQLAGSGWEGPPVAGCEEQLGWG